MQEHKPKEHHQHLLVALLMSDVGVEDGDKLVKLQVVFDLLLLFEDGYLSGASVTHVLGSRPHEDEADANDDDLASVLNCVSVQCLDYHCIDHEP